MERYDIINEIISKYNTNSYLEIGVRNPWECFDRSATKGDHPSRIATRISPPT